MMKYLEIMIILGSSFCSMSAVDYVDESHKNDEDVLATLLSVS